MPPPIVVTTCTTELPESSVLFDVKEERAMRNTTATMSSSIMSAMSAPGSGELTGGRLPLSRNILPIMAVLLMLATIAKMMDWRRPAPRMTEDAANPRTKATPISSTATPATLPASFLSSTGSSSSPMTKRSRTIPIVERSLIVTRSLTQPRT